MLQDLLTLWSHGFPDDTEEDARNFIEGLAGVATPYIRYGADGTPLSMAFTVPATFGGYRLAYIYAAATHRKHRGRSHFTALLEEIVTKEAARGVNALFLRPATASLFGFYARCGFAPCFWAEEKTWQVNSLYKKDDLPSLSRVDSAYTSLRGEWLKSKGVPFISWPDEVAAYAVKTATEAGGGAFSAPGGLALCQPEGETLTVWELLCDPAEKDRVLASLAREIPCRQIRFRTPSKEDGGQVLGMIRPLAFDQNIPPCGDWYMGFTLE